MSRKDAPAAGQAPMPAADAAALLRRNATDPSLRDRPAIRFGDRTWTHGEYVAEARRCAHLFRARLPEGAPPHVGVLLDNTPEYLFAFGGAALSGATVVGLNHTRRGEHLLRDIEHTDVGLAASPSRATCRCSSRSPTGLPDRCSSSHRSTIRSAGDDLDAALAASPATTRASSPTPTRTWALIFTSGTSSAPKAVICTQRRLLVTGTRMADDHGPRPRRRRLRLHAAVPLQRGDGRVGAVARRRRVGRPGPPVQRPRAGCPTSAATAPPGSTTRASRCRTSWPRPSSPTTPTTRCGSRSATRARPRSSRRSRRRFGVRGHRRLRRHRGRRRRQPRRRACRPARSGGPAPNVKVVDEDGNERPPGPLRRRRAGCVNADECVGEIVNTAGAGPFEGYYNNDEANAAGHRATAGTGAATSATSTTTATSTSPAAPPTGSGSTARTSRPARSRTPSPATPTSSSPRSTACPTTQAGDQVMAALVLRDGADVRPGARSPAWLDAPARPRAEVAAALRARRRASCRRPGTNKIVKRTLARQKFRRDLRRRRRRLRARAGRRRPTGRSPPTTRPRCAAASTAAGRDRFWDL